MNFGTFNQQLHSRYISSGQLLVSLFLFFPILGLTVISCDDELDNLGFSTNMGSAVEDAGKQSLIIDLGEPVSSDVTIGYRVSGTASLDGDFYISADDFFYSIGDATAYTFSVIAKKGSSTATIEFVLVDDTFIEKRNEIIYFEITSVSDNGLSSKFKKLQYQFVIEDNDTAPTDGLQVDLSWYLGEGVSINASNFDLYLARNVEFNSNGDITTYELIDGFSSTKASGFESFIIPQSLENDEYYILIRYLTGTISPSVYLTLSQGSQSATAAGQVSSDYAGKDLYYGPISKQGTSFEFLN